MARTRHLHPLLAEHRTLVRDVRQLSHTLQTTAERLTATLQQAQAHLDALGSVRRDGHRMSSIREGTPMTPETLARFDHILQVVQAVDRRLREALAFKTYVCVLVQRYQDGALPPLVLIRRLEDLVAHEQLDDIPDERSGA